MANALIMAGATAEPSNFVPLHTNRIFTGLWTNRSPMRDAATSDFQEHYGMGRQDSIWDGYNSEISPRLTLVRRPGTSLYNSAAIPPVKRFYSFNTFTLTNEVIRVMADTALIVYDVTAGQTPKSIFVKSGTANGNPTYFLGVGNTLYFTNGVDNKQVTYDPVAGEWGPVTDWGIDAPTTAPTASQVARPNPYPAWAANTVFSSNQAVGGAVVLDTNGNLQRVITPGLTGAQQPNPWNPTRLQNTTDGSVVWQNMGPQAWINNHIYSYGDICEGSANEVGQLFWCIKGGNSGAAPPPWTAALGALVSDGADGTEVTWQNGGILLSWYGPNIQIKMAEPPVTFGLGAIVDSNGYLEQVAQPGVTGPAPGPKWQEEPGAYTTDNTMLWLNAGPYASGTTAPWQYGYAYVNSATGDISNMSPPSAPISVSVGGQVIVQGAGSADPQVDTIVLYRTPQGGSTFLFLDTIPNPGAGKTWTYTDTTPDSGLNTEIQAQVDGEGTPLPEGATCLGYHLNRIFAAVGNVVYISSGPDAIASTSSGNAGFDTTFTAQSRITRFWTCSLGMVVFTVRDAYIILGSATDADPLYMVVFIEDLPLRSYDCFTVNKTTPYLLMGNNQLVSLDPSAGIMEVGFPIADRLMEEYDAAASYVTFHSQSSLDTALYVANGNGSWYRMAQNNAPEQGSAWSTKTTLAGITAGCVQSVEVTPGTYRLLISGTSAAGPILQRDRTKNTDNGQTFAVQTVFGSIVLAQPGQLAALSFVTLESARIGTRAGLALLLGEIFGEFEPLNRTRQDPPILPPSSSLYSDRYHFAQSQNEAWCRHFQMEISWPAEDAANELLTFTIFGQTWQEMRSQ